MSDFRGATDVNPGSIRTCILRDGEVSVSILNLGCITQDWRIPTRAGALTVVLGYRDPAAYLHNPAYLGAVVGRVANRIGHARYHQDGQLIHLRVNDGPHMLHGGPAGLSTRIWEMEQDGASAVVLKHTSPDGDQGFPGRAAFEVRIALDGFTVTYDMRASVDRETPINLAQHNYYRLAQTGDVRDYALRLAARHVVPTDAELIPLGPVMPVQGSRFDFLSATRFAQADPVIAGYDHYFVLDPAEHAVEMVSPNRACLTLETDQPGLQFYSAGSLVDHNTPLPGQVHQPYSGVCFEPHGFPDAVNQPTFPSIMASPDAPYAQRLRVTVTPGEM